MDFLQACLQCRELTYALQHLAGPASLHNVTRAIRGGLVTLPANTCVDEEQEVSSEIGLVAKLVLKDLEVAEVVLRQPPTEMGAEVVRALQAAAFGEASLQQSFMQCVFLAPLPQAKLAQQLCMAALLDLLAPANCLSLYTVASSAGCALLARAAAACALAHFGEAARLDYSGLVGLEEAALMGLLCSDALVVESETEVFNALVAWVEADRASRAPRFAARLAQAVRLGQADTSDLAFMDVHPLVAADRTALSLVAHSYICKLMGLEFSAPFGLDSIARPRRCQRTRGAAGADASAGPATPALPTSVAAGGLACGSARHAHASLFEAAMCAWASHATRTPRPALAQPCTEEAAEELATQAADAVRRLSVEGASGPTSAAAAGPDSPALPGLGHLPTPTNAGAGAAAPKLAPVSRMHHFGSARTKRSASRRSLFSMVEEREEGEEGCSSQASAATAEGRLAGGDSKSSSAATLTSLDAAAAPAQPQRRLSSGVALEMGLSPSKAGLAAMAEQRAAAAAATLLSDGANWQSRKRLRFL